MHQLNAVATPNIQFPLRLSHDLSNRLNETAKSTRIPKTTLGRLAIKSLLDDIEEKGVTRVLSELNE
jgi:predicted DNA-binding protein